MACRDPRVDCRANAWLAPHVNASTNAFGAFVHDCQADMSPTEIRRAHEDALLLRYREILAAHGITLDAETAWEQYRLFTIYGWCAATCTAAMGSKWQPEHIGLGGTERATIAAVDLDCVGLLAHRLD